MLETSCSFPSRSDYLSPGTGPVESCNLIPALKQFFMPGEIAHFFAHSRMVPPLARILKSNRVLTTLHERSS